jgi:hypothetical protein
MKRSTVLSLSLILEFPGIYYDLSCMLTKNMWNKLDWHGCLLNQVILKMKIDIHNWNVGTYHPQPLCYTKYIWLACISLIDSGTRCIPFCSKLWCWKKKMYNIQLELWAKYIWLTCSSLSLMIDAPSNSGICYKTFFQ